MVLNDKIKVDKELVINRLDEYKNNIQNLNSSWIGDSYTNLYNQVNEFVDKYEIILEEQMNNFSYAWKKYETYKSKKELFYSKKNTYLQLVENRKKAIIDKDSSKEKSYADKMDILSNEIKELKNELFELKEDINIILSTISKKTTGDIYE